MVRILIAEPLAEAGVELLRAHYEVDARAVMSRGELLREVVGVDALVVRSATRVDAEVLEAGRPRPTSASARATGTARTSRAPSCTARRLGSWGSGGSARWSPSA